MSENMIDVKNLNTYFNSTQILKNINIFLDNLSQEKRVIFRDRYWSLNSIENISNKYQLKKGNVKMILSRTRKDLKEYLKGVDLI